jgi:phospholipid-binding lipoprotein MlaA
MKIHHLAALLIAAALTGGCASVSGPSAKADPFESFNRTMYAFNDGVDKAVLKPVAQGYQAITPDFVRAGVTNAFENVSDVKTALNNLLQGKVGDAASDVGRVVVNTVLGVFGLWDVATPMGLEKHEEDFGQTLGKWGVGSGPYLMLPLMGPSTLRDGIGRVPDSYAGYNYHIDHRRTANVLFVTEIVNGRAHLLAAEKTLDEAALDKYTFLRDAYLQRRLRVVHDGKVPQAELDKLEDSLEPAETGGKPAAAGAAKPATDDDKKAAPAAEKK